ncbi:MAG: FAD-dependent oxidoreductase [Gammaproteobacteria bacterium]|nr:FAD-dependent oxidoreductase [Gammaproteobacteria bacterium]
MPIKDRKTADSYYEASRNLNIDAAMVDGDLSGDVVVIGGGLTGSSTALNLAKSGVDVILLEAEHFGWGASGRSGGQIINGYAAEQDTLEELVGMETARELWEHSLGAVEYTRQLIFEYNIDCDLKMGYLHVGVKPKQAQELEQWAEHLSRVYGYEDMTFLERDSLRTRLASERYSGGVFDAGSGHLHPLNYCLGVVRAARDAGARLYERSSVDRITSDSRGKIVHCAKGTIRCDQVVYACNAYLDGLEPEIGKKSMPVGTYIVATEPLSESQALSLIPQREAVADTNFVLDYFRLSKDNRMLFGGRVSYSTLQPLKLTESLKKRMKNVFPQLGNTKIEFSWGGYVSITINRAPHIGQLDHGIWYAQGFSGHGMALSGYVGKLLSEAITVDRERIACFEKIPHKRFPGGSWLRTPALVAAMSYYKLKDYL